MDWKVKGYIQRALDMTPGGALVNDLLQRLNGGRQNLGDHINVKVRADWLIHMDHLNELGFTLPGKTMLEIGTGWLPVMPLCFALAGISRCITVDLRRHMSVQAVLLTLRHLEPHLADIAKVSNQPLEQVNQRWRTWLALNDGQAVLDAAGIVYKAPGDATATGLAAGSVDLVFSNSVLEHVPEPVLHAMMTETQRILSPDGLTMHNVNCGDHYAYFDRSITQINYLQFPDKAWRKWNTNLQYQNRLRAVDFLTSARKAGLEIVLDTHKAKPELLTRIKGMQIADEFSRYPVEELCCTSIDFAARKARP
jgi:hypothetical protein